MKAVESITCRECGKTIKMQFYAKAYLHPMSKDMRKHLREDHEFSEISPELFVQYFEPKFYEG